MSSWHLHPGLLSTPTQDERKMHSKSYRKWTYMTIHEYNFMGTDFLKQDFWVTASWKFKKMLKKCTSWVSMQSMQETRLLEPFIDDISLWSRLSVTSCNDGLWFFSALLGPYFHQFSLGPCNTISYKYSFTTVSRCGSADLCSYMAHAWYYSSTFYFCSLRILECFSGTMDKTRLTDNMPGSFLWFESLRFLSPAAYKAYCWCSRSKWCPRIGTTNTEWNWNDFYDTSKSGNHSSDVQCHVLKLKLNTLNIFF